jgi:hypothetical protein
MKVLKRELCEVNMKHNDARNLSYLASVKNCFSIVQVNHMGM